MSQNKRHYPTESDGTQWSPERGIYPASTPTDPQPVAYESCIRLSGTKRHIPAKTDQRRNSHERRHGPRHPMSGRFSKTLDLGLWTGPVQTPCGTIIRPFFNRNMSKNSLPRHNCRWPPRTAYKCAVGVQKIATRPKNIRDPLFLSTIIPQPIGAPPASGHATKGEKPRQLVQTSGYRIYSIKLFPAIKLNSAHAHKNFERILTPPRPNSTNSALRSFREFTGTAYSG